jgi:TonB-dependent SusC/RagA subfamily outer membrane receptor
MRWSLFMNFKQVTMRKILLGCFACLVTFCAMAQNRVVTGKVTASEDGSGLPGVNVIVKGTTSGTVSDADGSYSISVPSNDAVLVFSFIGYTTLEVTVGDRSTVDGQMILDVKQLSEIVVTGQGAGIEKRRLSTTVDVVDSEKLKNAPAIRLDQLLQSKLPNTQINMSSGAPGTTSIIRSRGVSSALKSSTPVIYIDGVRVDNLNTQNAMSFGTGGAQSSALSDIPVEDIDRIEFVKGGAATTLYGADAANGVIQIFTKRGKSGQNQFSFETQLGAIIGTEDFFKYQQTPDAGFRKGFLQSYRLGASGGSNALTYSVSGNVLNDNSFTYGLEQTRYNLRGSLNAKISEKANYSMSTAFTGSTFTRLNNANSGYDVVYGIDQGQKGDPNLWDEATTATVEQQVRDVAELADFRENVTRFQTSHGFIFNPIEKIQINLNLGLDYRYSKQKELESNAYLIALGAFAPGTTTQGNIAIAERNFLTTTGSLNAQYTENLNDFSFITTVGGQFFRDNDSQYLITSTNVTEGSSSVNAGAVRAVTDFISVVTNYGFFAAENIGFKNKYFVDLGVRIDYNTAFGDDVGGQVFPKAGFAYALSEEQFMKGISNVVSSLKLRASYGVAGNFPPAFTKDKLVLVNTFNGQTAYQPGQPGDRNLGPEKTKTIEVGSDISFWNNKITFGLTYFNALTEDALFTAPYAPSQGDENQTRNLGEISNKGFELSANFLILSNKDWELSVNASANGVTNKVEDSGGAPEFSLGGFTFLGSFVKEGLPVGYFRGGRPTFAADGTIASVEQNANLGSAIPDVFGSFGLNLSYKGTIQLFVSGDYQVGAEVVNPNEVLRFSRGLGDDRVPAASTGASFFDLASVWVENGDYLKIRNIAVSYNLPSSWFGNRIRNASIGLSALNPFNFVSGPVDPEVNGAGAPANLPGTNTAAQGLVTVGGFSYGTYSAPRQFVGTLRFNF